MSRSTSKRWDMGVAFIAAYMLVLQGLIGAFAIGAASASPQLDAFGNPLCITSSDTAASADGGDATHSAMPDCCTVACNMFAPVPLDGHTTAALENPLASDAVVLEAKPESVRAVPLHRGPGSPRSPPHTV